MTGLFNKPNLQAAATPAVIPPAPSLSNTTFETDAAAQQIQAQVARGRTSTVLNGGAGLANVGDTTSKRLLGQ